MKPYVAIQELQNIQEKMSPYLSSTADNLIDACIDSLRQMRSLAEVRELFSKLKYSLCYDLCPCSDDDCREMREVVRKLEEILKGDPR